MDHSLHHHTGKRVPFPLRLWEAVNDSESIISWTSNGRAVTVDEERFEREGMTRYPGLVQVPSFANLRRQLRAYNFEWRLLESEELVFYHPCFCRDEPDMLEHVYTRRRVDNPSAKAEKGKESSQPSSPRRPASVPPMTCSSASRGTTDGHTPQRSASVAGVCRTCPFRQKRRYKRRRHPKDKEDLPIVASPRWDEGSRQEKADEEGNAAAQILQDSTVVEDAFTYVIPDVNSNGIGDVSSAVTEEMNDVIDDVGGDVLEKNSSQVGDHSCTCDGLGKAVKEKGQGRHGAPAYPGGHTSAICMNHICAFCSLRWMSPPVTAYHPYNFPSEFVQNPKQPMSFYCYRQDPAAGMPKEYTANSHMTTPHAYRLVSPMVPNVYQPVVMGTAPMNGPKAVYVTQENQGVLEDPSNKNTPTTDPYHQQSTQTGCVPLPAKPTMQQYDVEASPTVMSLQPSKSPKQYQKLESIANWYAPYRYPQYSQRYPEVHKALTGVHQRFPQPKPYIQETPTSAQTMNSQQTSYQDSCMVNKFVPVLGDAQVAANIPQATSAQLVYLQQPPVNPNPCHTDSSPAQTQGFQPSTNQAGYTALHSAQQGIQNAQQGIQNTQQDILTAQQGAHTSQQVIHCAHAQQDTHSAQQGIHSAQQGFQSAQQSISSVQQGINSTQQGIRASKTQNLWPPEYPEFREEAADEGDFGCPTTGSLVYDDVSYDDSQDSPEPRLVIVEQS